MATHPATGQVDDEEPAQVESVTHTYPRQAVRVGVAGYKGKVTVYDDPETKARGASEDKARGRGQTK